MQPQEGCLLRIFIGESDKKDCIPLYEWIVRKAKEDGIAGATVLRGIQGYGAHQQMHMAKILQLSTDLPIVIELIDTFERMEAFMTILADVMASGVITQEKVTIRLIKSK